MHPHCPARPHSPQLPCTELLYWPCKGLRGALAQWHKRRNTGLQLFARTRSAGHSRLPAKSKLQQVKLLEVAAAALTALTALAALVTGSRMEHLLAVAKQSD